MADIAKPKTSNTLTQAIAWTLPASTWMIVCVLNLCFPVHYKHAAILTLDFAAAACFSTVAAYKFFQAHKERRMRAEEL